MVNSSEKSSRIDVGRIVMLALIIVLLVVILFVYFNRSLGWFAMNSEVEAGGMGVKSQVMPYTIQTRNGSGYYKDKWDKINSDAIEWQVSSSNNFDNHGEDLDGDEEEPGLEPGDSGMLEFRVNPNTSDSITVDCIFDFKAYIEEPVLDGNGDPVLDGNGNPVTEITEINNTALVDHVKTHIMLFTNYDTTTGKYSGLISTDEDIGRVLKDQTYTRNGTTYTTIYWKWPKYLEELTSHDDAQILYDPDERESVINYIAANRTGFFKDCNDTEEKVKEDLTALSEVYNYSVYKHYNLRYDNADLDIGNNISYVMLSMTVSNIIYPDTNAG